MRFARSKKSRIHVWPVRCVWSPQEPQRGSILGQWIIWTCINKNPLDFFNLGHLGDLLGQTNQWDPSIISTEPTRTDGPSRSAIKFSQRRLYHSECITRVFSALLSIQSRSRSHLWPLRPDFTSEIPRLYPLSRLEPTDRLLGAITSSQRRLYHSECVTCVFSGLLSIQSRLNSFLTSQIKVLPVGSLDYIDRADWNRLWSLEGTKTMQIIEVMYSSIQSDLQSILGNRNHPMCVFRSISVHSNL